MTNLISKSKDLWSLCGPGLLYAGAAVGVSHLVQSTRAGAEFGYGLLWAVILANLVKYPFFRMATEYTAHTRQSILSGYLKQGTWAVLLFIGMTVSTMFIMMSAITVVTAGLFIQVFNFDLSIVHSSLIILFISGLLISLNKVKSLNDFIKVIIIVLSLTTIVACLSSFFKPHFSGQVFQFSNHSHVAFLIALMGWMPAPMDLSVWQSEWYVSKVESDQDCTPKNIMIDFNIGYLGTLVLALLFVLLGKNMMYGSGLDFQSSSIKFSGQLIDLYTKTLGERFSFVISIAALTTMMSTSLTCLDAFPRSLSSALSLTFFKGKRTFIPLLFLIVIGTGLTILFFLKDMRSLVDLATIISFLVTPIIAWLNLRSWGDLFDKKFNNSKLYQVSLFFLIMIILFCLFYLTTFF